MFSLLKIISMKRKLILVLRKLGLMGLADKLRYFYHLTKTKNERRSFIRNNKSITLPPPYFIYETFRLNYKNYYFGGLETAKSLIANFKKHISLEQARILDWGCGPGRTIRHFPVLLPDSEIFGSDYNSQYIDWCQKELKGVTFKSNMLSPPLKFEDNYFDVIYGISIFTHLSEEKHYEWVREFSRVLKTGGVLYVTTHGSPFRCKLSEADKNTFDKGNLVFSKKTKEGHRTFVAFHPEVFMRELFSDFEVVEYVSGQSKNGSISQDTWIVKKV